MARQRVHNRRAGHGASASGASWISYSDMMAALLLVFVLILCYSLYQYFSMLETKTQELETQKQMLVEQQTTLDEQTATLSTQQTTMDEQTAKLASQQAALDAQASALATAQANLQSAQSALNTQQAALDQQTAALDNANATLVTREQELSTLQSQLATQQTALDAATELLDTQKAALAAQTTKIDDLVGVRTKIIQELSTALSSASLKAKVDKNTGDIVLDSTVFFETGSNVIKQDGKTLLDKFIPVYLSVLLRPEYQDYLGEIIIEGHTDTKGEYFMNLELSQNRALSVAKYCLQMDGLTDDQRTLLRSILTAKGKSYSDPVYNSDGSVNMDASRRVEFKFSLKDAEMIEEMNRLLQTTESGDGNG